MEFEVYSLENEQQFWDELQQIVSTQCDSEDLIDNALRAYLGFTTKYKDEYLSSEDDISRCSYRLLSSSLFASHVEYVRRQIIYSLLQEDDPHTLHLIVSFLLCDGRQHEVTFQQMNEEGAFSRLLELIQSQRRNYGSDGAGLHRLLMDLLYEMSRIQRVKVEDLVLVDDEFIKCLFEIIEDVSYDANDPYHYPVIRVLLVLNEQFMISAHDPVDEGGPSSPLTNKVIKILSMHGYAYKTFGENIILLINREGETSLQLLTLKLLYLLFTTPSTYEYFYTNDLRVLVDILIRNLLDLPEEASALRHTYLRVLYPLLAHTQLKYPPHYKRDELKRVLSILAPASEEDCEKILHFADADETTKRLVARCATVEWLRDAEPEVTPEESPKEDKAPSEPSHDAVQSDSPAPEAGEPLEVSRTNSSSVTLPDSPDTYSSPVGLDGPKSLRSDYSSRARLNKSLGMHLAPASESSLSVREVAAQHEKPGVMTPSRNDTISATATFPGKPKVKPEPPKTRRWRGRRIADGEEASDKMPECAGETGTGHVPVDRRNSASSPLAPPVPAHTRRSASNPPPAVPPPRRSSHPVQAQFPAIPTSPQKHGQRPEPPRTRRWARGKHAQTQGESMIDSVLSGSVQAKVHDGPTVSVEEAVQNVSIND